MTNIVSKLKGGAAAVFVAAAAALPGGLAIADDAPNNAFGISSSNELTALGAAEENSVNHARSGWNIGLVLHAGDDVPNERFPTAQSLADFFQAHYQSALDDAYPDKNGSVEVFIAPNPGSQSSLITATVGDQVQGVNNAHYGRPETLDPSLLDLSTAYKAADEMVSLLPVAKALQEKNEADGYFSVASLDSPS